MTAASEIQLVRCPDLWPKVPYAYAAVVRNVPSLVFTAGACPLDPDGVVVAAGDVAGQAEQAMGNLEVALAPPGLRSPTSPRRRSSLRANVERTF